MTALLILAAILIGALVHQFTDWNGYLFQSLFGDWLTVYVAAFLVGLIAASFFALRSRDRRCIAAAGVLWLNFIGSHLAWAMGDPELYIAGFLDVLTAAYFVLWGQSRWEWVIGGLFLLSVAASFLAFVGVVPGPEERAGGFIAFSMPDIAAILGHLANAVLGLGSGDAGRRVRARAIIPVPWARMRPMGALLRRSTPVQ